MFQYTPLLNRELIYLSHGKSFILKEFNQSISNKLFFNAKLLILDKKKNINTDFDINFIELIDQYNVKFVLLATKFIKYTDYITINFEMIQAPYWDNPKIIRNNPKYDYPSFENWQLQMTFERVKNFPRNSLWRINNVGIERPEDRPKPIPIARKNFGICVAEIFKLLPKDAAAPRIEIQTEKKLPYYHLSVVLLNIKEEVNVTIIEIIDKNNRKYKSRWEDTYIYPENAQGSNIEQIEKLLRIFKSYNNKENLSILLSIDRREIVKFSKFRG